MKTSRIIPVLLAVLLIAAASVTPALSYFTGRTERAGAIELKLEPGEPESEEYVKDMEKHLTVSNDGSPTFYVRARAYAPEGMTLTYSGAGWTDGGDGWYYYGAPVESGEKTEELLVRIGNIPEEAEEGDVFDIPVVYETTPAQYKADGSPYADWDYKLVVVGG